MDEMISRISLKQSIAASAILKDKKTLEQIIDEEPSIDAVPVIRCKDCMWWDTSWEPTRAKEGEHWCSAHDIYMVAEDFCSQAERKES